MTLGPTALVRIEGTEIDVILNTNRTQTFEPDIFSNLGIDPLAKDILLVKSTNHFYAGFAPIAAEIIYVSAPSSYPSNPALTDYRKLKRPIWPRVADPWKLANLPPCGGDARQGGEGREIATSPVCGQESRTAVADLLADSSAGQRPPLACRPSPPRGGDWLNTSPRLTIIASGEGILPRNAV